METRFYTVNDDYIDYLYSFDSRVQKHHNDGYPKPYVGVIITLSSGHNYFVPLSSPKDKHKTMKESVTFMKVMDGTELLAVINIINMVPVPDSEFKLMEFEDYTIKHQDLLNKEYREVKRLFNRLLKNANNLYRLVTLYPEDNKVYRNLSCDFKLLEEKCDEFIRIKRQAN